MRLKRQGLKRYASANGRTFQHQYLKSGGRTCPAFVILLRLQRRCSMKKQDEKQLRSYPADSPVSPFQVQEHKKDLPILGISGLKWSELFPNCTPLGCLGRMLPGLSIWGSTKRYLTWSVRDTLFKHTYIRLAASARGTNAQELLSWALMFPTPLASDNTNNKKDAMRLNVYLSEGGVFRKKNPNGRVWSIPLSAAVFYLTPIASDGMRSNFPPEVMLKSKDGANLAAQIVQRETPSSDKAALNPDWVEWLMGFPYGWTDIHCGNESLRAFPV